MKYTPKKQFVKDVQVLPKRVKEEISQLLQEIEKAEDLNDIASVKKMAGYADFYRIRIGITGLVCLFWTMKYSSFVYYTEKRFIRGSHHNNVTLIVGT